MRRADRRAGGRARSADDRISKPDIPRGGISPISLHNSTDNINFCECVL